ncbi:MAG: hypothetical protein HPY50_15130 [Firmicutes bacterium]|nr:hypothetical protein [Bacillota bacterium]
MRGTTTSWVVAGLGAAVTGVGATLLKGPIAAGAMGFGLAHVLLGVGDMFRPSVRR